jgi:hypothetical protein
MLIFLLLALIAACVVAGCVTSPSPTPAPTVTPTPVPTISAAPTLIGKSDEAHIKFTYQLGTASEYSGLQKASPGNLLYLLQVKVSSDKPVQTSQDWFWMEYKSNESDDIHSSHSSISFVKYPTKVLNNSTDFAGGELIFELPANMAPGYPKPFYFMPFEEQQGAYKVYDKVYGTMGDVQGNPLK